MHGRKFYSSDARKMHSNVLAPSILVDIQIILENIERSPEKWERACLIGLCPENKKLKGIVTHVFTLDVPNLRYCLYNHVNVEHTTKLLGQKIHPSKLPSIKGSKQNVSSLTDDGKL
uniref:Uncharacterized protein n=1 Tax=Romanomermis culicivorax TaxID=13658 RepID=A0A915KSU7_ROMCU